MSDMDDIEGRAGRLKAAFPGTFTEDGTGFVSFDVDAIRKVIGWGEQINTRSGVSFERSRDCIWVHVETQVGNSVSAWSWQVEFDEWERVVAATAAPLSDMDAKGRRGRGWHPTRRGEAHQAARLSDAQVAAIRKADASGESRRSIARRFGVSHTYVGVLARGQMRT